MSALPHSTVISLRASLAQRKMIDRAARLQGKNRTHFMLEASREKAEQVLLDQTLFAVDTEQYAAFEALMNAPLADNEGVQRLLAQHTPWTCESPLS